MTETPDSYNTSDPDSLRKECHQLIEQIAYRPGAVKLLIGLRDMAQTFANYKANRTHRSAHPPTEHKPFEAPIAPQPKAQTFRGRHIN